MKPLALAAILIATFSHPLQAQSSPAGVGADDQAPPDVVADAIRRFRESRGLSKPGNEVTVDLTKDTGESAAQPVPAPETKPAPPPAKPEPAADPAPPTPTTDPASETPPKPPAEPTDAPPKETLTVKVERLQTGKGPIDPAAVKLLAPFPAKPLGEIPRGWKLDSPSEAPAFSRNVELAPNTSISLTIRPHVLVPDANGNSAFSVAEPGFDSTDGYHQIHTVGAVLARSLEQLDEDSKHLGTAIEQLQTLVSALPKPAAKPAPAKADSKPATVSKPAPKR